MSRSLNKHERRQVQMLERRAGLLTDRLKRWETKHGSDSWTRKELAAIGFALRVLNAVDDQQLMPELIKNQAERS